jgi:hypothetical protein
MHLYHIDLAMYQHDHHFGLLLIQLYIVGGEQALLSIIFSHPPILIWKFLEILSASSTGS